MLREYFEGIARIELYEEHEEQQAHTADGENARAHLADKRKASRRRKQGIRYRRYEREGEKKRNQDFHKDRVKDKDLAEVLKTKALMDAIREELEEYHSSFDIPYAEHERMIEENICWQIHELMWEQYYDLAEWYYTAAHEDDAWEWYDENIRTNPDEEPFCVEKLPLDEWLALRDFICAE